MLVKDAMQSPPVTIGAHAPLPEAVVRMQDRHVTRLPVMEGDRLVGLLSRGEVQRHLPDLTPTSTAWDVVNQASRVQVGDVMVRPVHTVRATEPLERAMEQMLQHRVGGLPVLDEAGGLTGMLTLTDILRAGQKAPRLEWGAVQQHMTRGVVTVTAETPLSEAAGRLRETRLRVLPVLEGSRLAGLLHESDVRARLEQRAPERAGLTARDLMRPPSGYLREGAPMHRALDRMLSLDVHGLPVIGDDGELLGVVTISDVLRTVLRQRRAT